MKKCNSWIRRARRAFSRIHLVDKCLILFMAVLLSQSAYSLFVNGGSDTDAGSVDVIVRTASAAVFGYFLSANFIRRSAKRRDGESTSAVSGAEIQPDQGTPENGSVSRGLIGFSVNNPHSEDQRGCAEASSAQKKADEEKLYDEGHLQIIAATVIGLFCLIVLILMRNAVEPGGAVNDSTAATMVQFRDFVSGCVGFLIGCPTSDSENK